MNKFIIGFISILGGLVVVFIVIFLVQGTISEIAYNIFISPLSVSEKPFPVFIQLIYLIIGILLYLFLGWLVRNFWPSHYPSIYFTIPVILPSLLFLLFRDGISDTTPGELYFLRIFDVLSPLAYIIPLFIKKSFSRV